MNYPITSRFPEHQPPRRRPTTVEEKLDDIIRRLGNVERHLIDLKGNPPPREQYRYQYEPENLN